MTDESHPTFSELIVAVDGHESDAVLLAHASALATRLAVPLTLLRQVSGSGVGRATREEMELLADRTGAPEVRVRIVDAEQPASAIVDAVEGHSRALLCLATRAPSAAGQLLFGSVAVEVARRSPVPVLLVGPAVEMPAESPAVTHIAVCLDGSDEAERGVALAVSLGVDLHLPVLLCQAVSSQSDEATFEWGYLAGVVERRGGGSQLDWKLVHNDQPATGLSGLAGDGPALLVMATHARRIGQRFREGSVTLDVVSTAGTPVLVLGPACRRSCADAAP